MTNMKIEGPQLNPIIIKAWLQAFGQNVSSLLENNCEEVINLILFKCPWMAPNTNHYKCFNQFMNFCIRLFGLRPSFIPPTLSSLLLNSLPSLVTYIFLKYISIIDRAPKFYSEDGSSHPCMN